MLEPEPAQSTDAARWARLRARAESLVAAMAGQPLGRERPRTHGILGAHGHRRAGTGEVFWQFRQYEASDPATAIDWRQSAKSDRLFVRQQEEEVAQTFWLWCDGSASMDYKSDLAEETKAERAITLSVAIALYFLQHGERVGLLGAGRSPVTSKTAIDNFRELLRGDQTPGDFAPLPVRARGGRIFLLGDFHEMDDSLQSALDAARQRGVWGSLIQILDPAEIDFPFEGHVDFEDVETGGRLDVGRAESLRETYRAEMQHWQDKLAAMARSAGWHYMAHTTDREPMTALRIVAETVAAH